MKEKLCLQILYVAGLSSFLIMSCASSPKDSGSPIQIWWRSDKQLFVYEIRPTISNRSEIAVLFNGKTLEGPTVKERVQDLRVLAKRAHGQVVRRKQSWTAWGGASDQLVVTYGPGADDGFSVHAPYSAMLQIFEDCPALKELVSLASSNQPKNYRILDEPTPLGAFERSNPHFDKNLIEVKWWQSGREETVYFIRPAKGNLVQVAVRVPVEKLLNGPALDSSFAEMQALTKKAHEEVTTHKELDLPFEHEKKSRVVVTYGGGPNEFFYVDGALTKLLARIEECPALKKLLLLVSKEQPKDHRILDN